MSQNTQQLSAFTSAGLAHIHAIVLVVKYVADEDHDPTPDLARCISQDPLQVNWCAQSPRPS